MGVREIGRLFLFILGNKMNLPRFCALFHRFKVTQYKNGCVYKTKQIGQAWYEWGKGPKCNIPDKNDELWAPTLVFEMQDKWEVNIT